MNLFQTNFRNEDNVTTVEWSIEEAWSIEESQCRFVVYGLYLSQVYGLYLSTTWTLLRGFYGPIKCRSCKNVIQTSIDCVAFLSKSLVMKLISIKMIMAVSQIWTKSTLKPRELPSLYTLKLFVWYDLHAGFIIGPYFSKKFRKIDMLIAIICLSVFKQINKTKSLLKVKVIHRNLLFYYTSYIKLTKKKTLRFENWQYSISWI